ncbi:MAG: hypothetical protein JO337_04385 [Acidimicrobiales bacterium]|nr:hypothetical protein [Acidimicrobiales bacterium]
MRGKETRYGYIVAAELVVVAILNLIVTHGKGAPAHPQTTVALIGLFAAIGLAALLRTRNRMIVGIGSVVASFFVSTLPQAPQSLSTLHFLALAIPLVYAFYLTQRQRRATTSRLRERRATASSPSPRESSGRRRKRKQAEEPTGPAPSRRYTPPKSKRSPTGKTGRR